MVVFVVIIVTLFLVVVVISGLIMGEIEQKGIDERQKRRAKYKAENSERIQKLVENIKDLCEYKKLNIIHDHFSPVYEGKTGCCIVENAVAFFKDTCSEGVGIHVFAYDRIVDSELVWEQETISTSTGNTSRDSAMKLGRAVVGGAIAGTGGAVVGGLSGKRKDVHTTRSTGTTRYKSIRLLITVDDIKESLFEVPFGEFDIAKKWESYFKVITKKNTEV